MRPTTGTLRAISKVDVGTSFSIHYGQGNGEGRDLSRLCAARLAVACAGALGAGEQDATRPVD